MMITLPKMFSGIYLNGLRRAVGLQGAHLQSQHSRGIGHEYANKDDMPVENMKNPYQKSEQCCVICKYKVQVDYKNSRLLSQFLSPFTGKIYERNITGLCKAQQKRVESEIIKAQNAGYLAKMLKKVEYLRDPKLFDVNRPIRPHKY